MNSAQEAVQLANLMVGTSVYKLGTGDNDTEIGAEFDCFGFACNKCYNIKRHRPGFNRGWWASVEDDLNCNSAIEDSEHKQELFIPADRPTPGDLLAYPTIRIKGPDGVLHKFIGHIGIVVGVPTEWDPKLSRYAELTVVQCRGPNGRKPGIIKTSGALWDAHDTKWPKPQHRSKLIRVKQASGEAKQ